VTVWAWTGTAVDEGEEAAACLQQIPGDPLQQAGPEVGPGVAVTFFVFEVQKAPCALFDKQLRGVHSGWAIATAGVANQPCCLLALLCLGDEQDVQASKIWNAKVGVFLNRRSTVESIPKDVLPHCPAHIAPASALQAHVGGAGTRLDPSCKQPIRAGPRHQSQQTSSLCSWPWRYAAQ